MAERKALVVNDFTEDFEATEQPRSRTIKVVVSINHEHLAVANRG